MLRALLVALIVDLTAGTPGLGLETRTETSAIVGALYFVPFAAAIAALVGTWRWRSAVRWLAWVAAISAAILSALDVLGLLPPERPGTAISVLDIAAIVIAAAIVIVTRGGVVQRD
jgi:hypothetical protein